MARPHVLAKFLLLLLLSIGVSHAETQNKLNQDTLVSVIKFFHNNYDPGSQYAIAINVPSDKCAGYVDESFLMKYQADKVKNGMNNSEDHLYTADELIAARPRKEVHIHCESTLLRNKDQRGKVPMERLLEKHPDGCVVFYTFNSPCVQTCTDPNGTHSILPALQRLFQNYNGPKAFVFTDVFIYDKPKSQLAKQLKLVDDCIPLYRCIKDETGEISKCFVCRGQDGIDKKCLE